MKALGLTLLALPFIVLTVYVVRTDGWRVAAQVWGATLVTFGCIVLGVYLFVGGAP